MSERTALERLREMMGDPERRGQFNGADMALADLAIELAERVEALEVGTFDEWRSRLAYRVQKLAERVWAVERGARDYKGYLMPIPTRGVAGPPINAKGGEATGNADQPDLSGDGGSETSGASAQQDAGAPEDRKPHREICHLCHEVNRVGFYVPDRVWEAAVHESHRHAIICLACFTRLADERGVEWDRGIEFYPVSRVSHDHFVASSEPDNPSDALGREATALARGERTTLGSDGIYREDRSGLERAAREVLGAPAKMRGMTEQERDALRRSRERLFSPVDPSTPDAPEGEPSNEALARRLGVVAHTLSRMPEGTWDHNNDRALRIYRIPAMEALETAAARLRQQAPDHEPRFDFVYGEHGPRLEYHFCREWEDGEGCYGGNPNHGYTLEEAVECINEHWREIRQQGAGEPVAWAVYYTDDEGPLVRGRDGSVVAYWSEQEARKAAMPGDPIRPLYAGPPPVQQQEGERIEVDVKHTWSDPSSRRRWHIEESPSSSRTRATLILHPEPSEEGEE